MYIQRIELYVDSSVFECLLMVTNVVIRPPPARSCFIKVSFTSILASGTETKRLNLLNHPMNGI